MSACEKRTASVRVAMSELERYTQARIGNVRAPETTGKFVAARIAGRDKRRDMALVRGRSLF